MPSDSDNDEWQPTKSSGTSASRREFEQKKAKKIARNMMLLLEMSGSVEGIQDLNVDWEPGDREHDTELASLCDSDVWVVHICMVTVVTCSFVYSRTSTASVMTQSDLITDDSTDTTGRESTTGFRLADRLSPHSLTSEPAADTETTAKVASPSANDACCNVGFEKLTTQIQSTAEMIPTADDDLETRPTDDGLGVGAVLGDGQAQADGECQYVSS